MSFDDKTKTIPIYINSEDRDPDISASSSDFTITFHKTLRNVRRIDISSVEIPHSWYNVDADNSTIMAIVDIGFGELLTYTTVTSGEYTVEGMRVEMERVLNNLPIGTWFVTYDVFTHKFTINGTFGGSPINFKILSAGSLNEILGFKNPPTVIAPIITSDSIIDVQPHRFLFIKSATLANNINTSYISSFKKAYLIKSGINSAFVVQTAGGTFTWNVPVFGSFKIDDILELMQADMRFTSFAGVGDWTLVLDRTTCKITVSNGSVPFYITPMATLASVVFNFTTLSTTMTLSKSSNKVDFSLHQDVIRKILVKESAFLEKVTDARDFLQENDYGNRFNISSIEFRLVDRNDNPIDLNGKDWSMTLLVSSNN
jgi:hypothetical protein